MQQCGCCSVWRLQRGGGVWGGKGRPPSAPPPSTAPFNQPTTSERRGPPPLRSAAPSRVQRRHIPYFNLPKYLAWQQRVAQPVRAIDPPSAAAHSLHQPSGGSRWKNGGREALPYVLTLAIYLSVYRSIYLCIDGSHWIGAQQRTG